MEINLDEIRKQIDEIDSSLLVLLAKRMNLARPIAEYKYSKGLGLTDPEREKQIIKRRVLEYLENNLGGEEFITDIFNMIFSESKRLQQKRVDELKHGK